jgi:hypothetical protein
MKLAVDALLGSAAVVAGWFGYGWPGVVLAATVIAFWMLLRFSRALRVLRNAGRAPVGHVESAVMFNAKLQPGMRLLDLVKLAGSLGERVGDAPEVWRWTDTGGAAVEATLRAARLGQWRLLRPETGADGQAPPPTIAA